MFKITPDSGRMRALPGDYGRVDSLYTFGGRVFTIATDRVSVLFGSHASTKSVTSCGQNGGSAYVRAITGDATTLYAGDGRFDAEATGTLPAVTACPFSGAPSKFVPPILSYNRHGPWVQSIALVGRHVLVFTIS